jgi:tRNA pseudouridine32 synthase/23S rRNA pseudouridine746 synthase
MIHLITIWRHRCNPIISITIAAATYTNRRTFSIKYFRLHQNMSQTANSIHSSPELKILYEDDHIVAVDKVFNMLSVPGKSELPRHSAIRNNDEDDEEEDDMIPLPKINEPYIPRYLEWKRAIQYTYDHSTILDEFSRQLLARLLECESFPRRKKKFFMFLDSITKNKQQPSHLDTKKVEIYEALWKELSRVDFDLHKRPVFVNREPGEHSVSELLENRYGSRVFHIHRLDQETSGIILFARTDVAASHMCCQFRDRQVSKLYRALVSGAVNPLLRRIDVSIRADLENRPMQVVDPVNGKESVTLIVDSLAGNGTTTMLTLKPLTGRTHQLRLHLASIGHPIIGDTLYASTEVMNLSPRLCLHAHSITFTHPVLDKVMEIKSEIPCDWPS